MNVKLTPAVGDTYKPPALLVPLKIVMGVPTPMPSKPIAARPLGLNDPGNVPAVPPERLSVSALAPPKVSIETTVTTAPKTSGLTIGNSV